MPTAAGVNASYADWYGHYLLSASPSAALHCFRYTRVDCGHLYTHPDLPIIPITNASGQSVGLLLGWAITAQGELCSDAEPIRLNESCERVDDLLTALYAISGRWLFFSTCEANVRVYLDPCGSQPLVYCPTSHALASTPALLPSATADNLDHELNALLDIPAHDRYYPFGLTPYRSIQRLLPNHYLDLNSWIPHRHYPTTALTPIDLGEAAHVVGNRIKHTATALSARYRLFASLTAGRDSRMLLACMKGMLDRVELFTREGFSGAVNIDIFVAKKIARAFDLPFEIIPRANATSQQLTQWQERVGHSIAGAVWRCARMDEISGRDLAMVPGACGELARAFERDMRWRPNDSEGTPLDAVECVSRLDGIPSHPRIIQAAERWLAQCPTPNTLLRLDLLFIELRLGCWGSPQVYGPRRVAPTVFLLNSRAAIEAMLRLTVADKRDGLLHQTVIERLWPELTDYPYNRPQGGRVYETTRRRLKKTMPEGVLFYARKVERRLWSRWLAQ